MARALHFPDARVVVVPHPIGGTPETTLDTWPRPRSVTWNDTR